MVCDIIPISSPTKFATPACIYPYDETPTKFYEVAGYGQDENGQQTNKLLKVQLKDVPIDECQSFYNDNVLEATSQICAGNYLSTDKIQDTCYGDSGSGMKFTTRNATENFDEKFLTPTLVGIVSFGIGCATEAPGVYVKISNYIDWMENVISPAGR